MNVGEYLSSIYYDPKKAGSFSGPRALYKAVRADGKRILSMKKIKDWLKSQDVYTLHRRVVRKFKRNKVYVEKMDEQWDLDLMDMTDYANENDGVRYVLMAIDVFSRYGWMVPLKSKKAADIVKGFDALLRKSNPRKPVKIRTDMGGEFVNAAMKKWFKQHDILHSVTYNEVKANYVERWIKTIKYRIIKIFQHKNKLEYLRYLDNVAEGYNQTYHRSIKMKPAAVSAKNEQAVWEELYVEPFLKEDTNRGRRKRKKKKFAFKVGEEVRISYLRKLFDRHYHQKWTGEIFVIDRAWWRDGLPIYELKDYNGEDVKGTFYEQELQPVTVDRDQPFKVEKVMETRGRGRNKKLYVKWLNWPDKYNSWVKASDIV